MKSYVAWRKWKGINVLYRTTTTAYVAAELWAYKAPFLIDDTVVEPPLPNFNRVTANQTQHPIISTPNTSFAQELENQKVIPSSIVIKPVDYPNHIINDKDVKEIEEAIGNIVKKSQGQISLNSVTVEQVKYGVMFIRSHETSEAIKLAAMIAAFPWARFGLPALQCISIRNFVSAPVCEIRIAQKGNNFDEVKDAAHNALEISTTDWRLIKKADAPSRRGCSFIFVCNKALQDKVLESPRGEIKFNFGFSHLKASVIIPSSYKVTRKLSLYIEVKILIMLVLQVKMVTTQDSTSPMVRWSASYKTFFEDQTAVLKLPIPLKPTARTKLQYLELSCLLKSHYYELICTHYINPVSFATHSAFVYLKVPHLKCLLAHDFIIVQQPACNLKINKPDIELNKIEKPSLSCNLFQILLQSFALRLFDDYVKLLRSTRFIQSKQQIYEINQFSNNYKCHVLFVPRDFHLFTLILHYCERTTFDNG